MPAFKRKRTTYKRSKLGPKVKRIVTSMYEKKAVDEIVATNYTPVGPNWSIASVIGDTQLGGAGTYAIAQGTNFNQRVGDVVTLHRIDFMVRITPAIAGAGNIDGAMCRFIVYHNKQANGTRPTATQIFVTDSITSLRNHLLRDRISVLKDYTHQMVVTTQNAGAALTMGPEALVQFSIYPKTKIHYNGTSGVLNEILRNDYGFAVCTDAGAGASCCTINVNAQVVYTDE